MKISTFFILRSIVALAYALTLLVIPGLMLSLYGITPEPGINLMSRFLAVELIFAGVMCLNARKFTEPAIVRSILTSLLTAEAVGVIVAVYGTLSGVFNSLGWSIVLIYGLFSLGYVYFLFIKTRDS
jgi:hypothetical protein